MHCLSDDEPDLLNEAIASGYDEDNISDADDDVSGLENQIVATRDPNR